MALKITSGFPVVNRKSGLNYSVSDEIFFLSRCFRLSPIVCLTQVKEHWFRVYKANYAHCPFFSNNSFRKLLLSANLTVR
jgi:hypothetical protein